MKKNLLSLTLMVIMLMVVVNSFAVAQEPTLSLEKSLPLAGSSGFLINYVEGTIAQSGSNMVALSASTSTNSTVDLLTQTLYLQVLSSSSWVNVSTFSNSAYNTDYISDFRGAYVNPGSTYRLLVVSHATDGTTDTREAYSNTITIQ